MTKQPDRYSVFSFELTVWAHFAGTFMTFNLSLWAHSIPWISSMVVSQADKLLAFILPKRRVKSFPLLSSHDNQSPLFLHRVVATLKFKVNTICNWELVVILHSRKNGSECAIKTRLY